MPSRSAIRRFTPEHVTFGVMIGIGLVAGYLSTTRALPLRSVFLAVVSLFGMIMLVQRTRLRADGHGVAWTVVGGLCVFAYGFSNISVPVGGALRIPLTAVALMAAILLLPSRTRAVRSLLPLLSALSAVVVVRLAIDIRDFGILAARDAVLAVDAWALLLGVTVSATSSRQIVTARLDLLMRSVAAWYALYPLSGWLQKLSPTVGTQRETSLLSFSGGRFFPALALLWFLNSQRSVTSKVIWVAVCAGDLLIAQSRASYLGLLLAFIVTNRRGRRGARRRVRWMPLVLAGVLAVVMLSLFPVARGRIGQAVSPATAVAQLQTLVGKEGPGSPLEHRISWLEDGWSSFTRDGGSILFGVGLGADLANGYQVRPGVFMRKPHNEFVEPLARLGILGATPLFILFLVAFRLVRTSARSGDEVGAWMTGVMAVLIIYLLTEPFLSFTYTALPAWFFVGLAYHPPASSGGMHNVEGLRPVTDAAAARGASGSVVVSRRRRAFRTARR